MHVSQSLCDKPARGFLFMSLSSSSYANLTQLSPHTINPNPIPYRFIFPITSLCCALSCSASLSGRILLKSPTTSFALPK